MCSMLSIAKIFDAAVDSTVIKLNPTLVSDYKKRQALSPSKRQCWSQRENDHIIIIFILFTVFSSQSIFWMFSGGREWMRVCVGSFIVKHFGSLGWSFHKSFFFLNLYEIVE